MNRINQIILIKHKRLIQAKMFKKKRIRVLARPMNAIRPRHKQLMPTRLRMSSLKIQKILLNRTRKRSERPKSKPLKERQNSLKQHRKLLNKNKNRQKWIKHRFQFGQLLKFQQICPLRTTWRSIHVQQFHSNRDNKQISLIQTHRIYSSNYNSNRISKHNCSKIILHLLKRDLGHIAVCLSLLTSVYQEHGVSNSSDLVCHVQDQDQVRSLLPCKPNLIKDSILTRISIRAHKWFEV